MRVKPVPTAPRDTRNRFYTKLSGGINLRAIGLYKLYRKLYKHWNWHKLSEDKEQKLISMMRIDTSATDAFPHAKSSRYVLTAVS